MIGLLTAQIDDKTSPTDLERIRRNIIDALRELQQLPVVATIHKADVNLADGETTHISHGLGRNPTMVVISPPRGASTSGRIEEVRSGIDRKKYVALKATGWGATITVDVEVK